ncbi:protein FAM200C-like [Diabrotica undecimpunctata]|uniref:protein FAM200C-like n=1 Tax=Diabrotica undecimpunctata TaxID=50387 RepID=UPI003B63DFE7
MLGLEAVEQILKVPLSNDTDHRRILDMSIDIQSNVRKVLANTQFALQLNESTGISGKAQLISFVRFVYGPEIIEEFLFCRELETTTTGADIFSTVDTFFQDYGLKWTNCIAICTDGAAAIAGNVKGFLSFAIKKNQLIIITHCFLNQEALVVKTMDGSQLGEVIHTVVSMINYIKTRPVKSRVFEKLCKDMGADHKVLLFHS